MRRSILSRAAALLAAVPLLLGAPIHIAQAATYSQQITVQFGSTYTGQTSNVRYIVIDAGGTTRIAATGTGVAEETDAAGSATTGAYAATVTFDTSWSYPLRVKWAISGQSGVAASAVIGSDRIAAVTDGYTSTVAGRIDAAISSRSTYAGADTAGTTTLLSRLTGTRAGNLDYLTGDAYARLGAPAGASISADIASNSTAIGTANTGIASLSTLIGTPAGASLAADIASNATAIAALPSASANATAVWAAGTRSLTDKAGFSLTSGERDSIAAAVLGGVIDGSVTLEQAQALQLAVASGKYTAGGITGTSPKTQTVTYYRQDGTTVLATSTTTYNSSNAITGRTVTFSNLP